MIQLKGFVSYLKKDVKRYNKYRWWQGITLGDLLDRAAGIHPEKEAFIDTISRVTYEEAREKTNRLAIGLIDLGIKSRDRVLIQIPNWNEFATHILHFKRSVPYRFC